MKQSKIHTEPNTPILDSLKNLNGFDVPKNYFDMLHNSIMENVKQNKTIYFTPRRIMTYAASILILVGISVFAFNNNKQIENELALNKITSEEFFDELIDSDYDLETSIEFDEILAEF